MQTSAPSAEVLLFQCGHCHAELSVPLALRNVVGPCPCCSQQIQAPLADRRLQLPPSEECWEEPMPETPHWMASPLGWESPVLSESSLLSDRSVSDRLMPRQLAAHDSLGFRAKLTMPLQHGVDVGGTDAPVVRNRDRRSGDLMSSQFWNGLRMTMVVTTGGLCATLALFLRDRHWVLDLPWRTQPASTVVEAPVRNNIVRTKALDPSDPFVVEDPADLEVVTGRPSLPPMPLAEPRTVPVNPSPIASGKGQPARPN